MATKKPAKKPAAKTKPAAGKTPTLAQMTKWFTSLEKTGSYDNEFECQAFFWDAIYSEHAEIERVFEAWADSVDPLLPMQMLEPQLVEAKNCSRRSSWRTWCRARRRS